MHDLLNRLIAPTHQLWLVDLTEGIVKCVVALLVYLLVRWVALRALAVVTRPILIRAGRDSETNAARLRTLEGLGASIVTYLLLFVVGVTLLGNLGIQIGPILASAGVAGLAISFGAQRLVRDVLTGFFILLEDQYRMGEVVTLIGLPGAVQVTGTVLEVGLRITRLQDASGKLVVVSNGDIGGVVNHSRGPITATIDVGVPPDTAVDQVQEILSSLALPDELFSGAARVTGVTALESSREVLRITAAAQPGKAPEAELALRRATGEALRRAGVEIR